MVVRLAHAYIYLLLVLELLLLIALLVVHASVLMGATELYVEFGKALFIGTVLGAIPTFSYIKNAHNWKDEIKYCPKWMWKSALLFQGYGVLVLIVHLIALTDGNHLFGPSLSFSALPLGFSAISFCILFVVVRTDALDDSELIKRTRESILFIAICVLSYLGNQIIDIYHLKR
jgi:hypothetical protein